MTEMTLAYDDPEAHDNIDDPVDGEWAEEINQEESDTIIDIQALLDEPEEKHLPGRHDQKTHGGASTGAQTRFSADPNGTGIPGGFFVDTVHREDTPEMWQALGMRMPTDDELLNAYAIDLKDENGNASATEITVSARTEGHGGIQIKGNAGGREGAAEFERYIYRDSDNVLVAYHAAFALTVDEQQKGLGMDMLERSEELYEKLGVQEIRLHANSSVGRYAWAKAGFDWQDHDREQYVDAFYSWMQEEGVSADDAPRSINHPWDIAAWVHPKDAIISTTFGYDGKVGLPISGKTYLIHSADSYDAVKRLDPDDIGYKIGKEYFKMRRSIRESLNYKALVEKFGLPEAERQLALFQEKNILGGQSLEVVSPGMTDMITLLTRQNELLEQLMNRGAQPQVVINNQLDPEPLAKAIRDAGAPFVEVRVPETVVNVNVPEQQAPIVNVTVPEQAAPIVEVHPVIDMPATKTETVQSIVQRGPDGKMVGATSVKTTEYEQ